MVCEMDCRCRSSEAWNGGRSPRPPFGFREGENAMKIRKSIVGMITLALSVLLTASIRTTAQTITSIDQITTNVRPVPEGQKMKIKAYILKRGSDSFIMRESNGSDTEVLLDSSTSVKTFRRD